MNELSRWNAKMKNLLYSQQLLWAFNDEKFILSYDFMCSKCFGILIKPVKCKFCSIQYCEDCLQSLPSGKRICNCTNQCNSTFEPTFIPELFYYTTFFILESSSETIKCNEINYLDATSSDYQNKLILVPSFMAPSTSETFSEYKNSCKVSSEETIIPLIKKFDPKKLIKTSKIIDFLKVKGNNLNLPKNYFYNPILEFFKHFLFKKEIKLNECIFDINFAFQIAQLISKSKRTLVSFEFMRHSSSILTKSRYGERFRSQDLKASLIIFNSLCLTKSIKTIKIGTNFFISNRIKFYLP